MSETRTERVYAFIQTMLRQQGYPPNIEEIAAGCHLVSDEVLVCLNQLNAARKLSYHPAHPRGMRLVTP